MPSWNRQACQRKTSSACVVTSFVLLVGLLMFVIVYLPLSWQDIGGQSSAEDMTHDSSDCRSRATVVTDKALMQRWDFSSNFSQILSDAEQTAREPAHRYMEKRHSVAIYMYTKVMLKAPNQDFETTEKMGQQLLETFESRSLYFSLSEAIQILKHSQVTCFSTTYRTETLLNLTVSNKHVRFSTFILGSDEWNFVKNTSCFEVYTCFGADITPYSALKQNRQVLVPPYEVFKVTDIQTDKQRCKVIYRLKSNLNCVYDRESNTLHKISVIPAKRLFLIFTITCIIIVCLLLPFIIVKEIDYHKKTIAHRTSSLYNRTHTPTGVVI